MVIHHTHGGIRARRQERQQQRISKMAGAATKVWK